MPVRDRQYVNLPRTVGEKRGTRTDSDEPYPWKKVDSSLDWNFTRISEDKNAAPLPTVSTLLVSALAHSGEFTNWWIIDGTSSSSVTFHLDNGVGNRKKYHTMESRAYFGMSLREWFTSHLGMMMAVRGIANARKQNALNP